MASVTTLSTNSWNRGVLGALRTLMHFIAVVHFWYGIYYDWNYVYFPDSVRRGNNFGGKFKFLTFLDMIIQAVFFTICIVNDFIGSNEISSKRMPAIRRLKDYIFAAFAYPLAFNVGVTFWGLWFVDRELVLPKVLDTILPSWLNHVMHTNIMIFITLELFTTFRKYPSRKLCLTSLATFMACYLVWLHIVKYYSGAWVYPVLEVLELPQRIVFFIGSILIGTSLYFLGEYMNKWVWKHELKQLTGGGRKGKAN